MDKNYIVNGIVGGVLPVLAASATTTAIKTTNAINVKIDAAVAAFASTAVMTAFPATITVPALSTGVIGVYVTAAGVMSYAIGTTIVTSTLPTNVIAQTSQFPVEVPGKALLGWCVVTATLVFTGGTTVVGTGNTFVYLDKPALSL